uniref:ribonuclease H2 subunit B isoform X1 n=1 Tax=Myxine glutinosa TaxID=7769 RepID=UPI00358E7BB9
MVARRRLSDGERWRIIGMIESGMSRKAVARTFGYHHSVITRLVQKHQETDAVKDRPRSGRPRVTTVRQDRALLRLVRRYPFASSHFLKDNWLPNRRLCHRTVRNRLKSAGLRMNDEKEVNRANRRHWVIIAPASVVEEESETLSDPYFVKLKHPGTGKGAVFLFGQNGRRIFEVKSFSEKCHSWFIGDRVQEDGHLLYATPIDPLFLCLPYLLQEERKDRFEPLQQLLTDEDFPSCSNIIRCLNLQGQLRHISEIRASSDEKEFFCYSEENTLKWLQTKVERLVNAIRDAGVSVGGAVTSAMFVRSGQDEAVSHDEYRRYAHGLVSEYLPLALRLRLQMHLGIPEIKDEEEEGPPIKRRKMSSESPECATASSRNKTKSLIKAPKQNAAQRALAKVDRTGMKTLSCYFGKRA